MVPEQEQRAPEQAPPDEPVDGVHETVVENEPDAASEVEQDLDELLARAGRADEYLALAQRTQADFENFRKRMARDVAAAEGRGAGRLARELLPALDNLDRALAALDESANGGGEDGAGRHLADGVRLVRDDLLAALGRAGIEPFSPQGERFDPTEHEAVAQQPVQGAEPGTVVEVYQQGFRQDGAVLRPARVVVAA
jgi:molecular chaperone GrpE